MDASLTPFNSISGPAGPEIYKARKSRFLGYCFPVGSVELAQQHLETLWKRYPDATHICYAYRIGTDQTELRMNDDGEPAYSAGAPIFGQIEALDLFNVLVAVVRYYGGTKLGVGGLIQAYRETARAVLETADIRQVQPEALLELEFGYEDLDAVMRLITQKQLELRKQDMGLRCRVVLAIHPNLLPEIREALGAHPGVHLSEEFN